MNKTYEPVLIRTAIVAIITAIVHVLVVTGKLPIDEATEDALAGVADAIGITVAAFWSRQGVVPVAKIEDALGTSEGVIDGATEAHTTNGSVAL